MEMLCHLILDVIYVHISIPQHGTIDITTLLKTQLLKWRVAMTASFSAIFRKYREIRQLSWSHNQRFSRF